MVALTSSPVYSVASRWSPSSRACGTPPVVHHRSQTEVIRAMHRLDSLQLLHRPVTRSYTAGRSCFSSLPSRAAAARGCIQIFVAGLKIRTTINDQSTDISSL